MPVSSRERYPHLLATVNLADMYVDIIRRMGHVNRFCVWELVTLLNEIPESLKSKTATPKPKETTPRRAAPRTRPGHVTHASESSAVSPVARVAPKYPSPRGSPSTLRQSRTTIPSSSPAKSNEDMTLVVPKISSFRTSSPVMTPAWRERKSRPMMVDEGRMRLLDGTKG